MSEEHNHQELLTQALAGAGLRATRQREQVFGILMDDRNHPTAEEVYQRARDKQHELSLATVYNCLDTLVFCGLVRQVHLDRESTRYCPNLSPHAHFHDVETGEVIDIDLPAEVLCKIQESVPSGFQINAIELNFRGRTAPKN